jgi:hypothetical protein
MLMGKAALQNEFPTRISSVVTFEIVVMSTGVWSVG